MSAPQDPTPDVIDFQFSIVGEGFLAAANSLITQMSSLQAHLEQFGGVAPEAAAVAATQSANIQAGFQHGPHAHTSLPPSIQPGQETAGGPTWAAHPLGFWMPQTGHTPTAAPGQQTQSGPSHPPTPAPDPTPMERLSRMGFTRRLGAYSRKENGWSLNPLDMIRQETGVVEARESYQYRNRHGYDPHNNTLGAQDSGSGYGPGTGGGGGGGPSLPPPDTHAPTWMRALQADRSRYERAQEGFQVPQFGEFTTQNKMNMAADWLTRSSVNSYNSQLDRLTSQNIQSGMSQGVATSAAQQAMGNNTAGFFSQGTGAIRGYGANLLRLAADNDATRLMVTNAAVRSLTSGRNLTTMGTGLGYGRGSSVDIPGTDIGFMLPGQGTGEGIRERWTATRLRMRSGISGDQANTIVGSLAQQGFSGKENSNIALNYISDLVRQGQDPEQASNLFGQAVRNGNASMSEVAKTLNDLGDAARSARVTLSTYMEGLNQFSEQAENQGALKGQGLALGNTVASALGIAPQQATQFLSSPIMQGKIMQKYGLLPNDMAALGSTAAGREAFGETTLDTIDTAMKMAQPFNRDTRGPDGKILVSGKDRQMAEAAKFAGVDLETFQRLLRNSDQSRHLITARTALETYRTDAHATGGHGGVGGVLTPGMSKPGDWIPATKDQPGAENHGGIWMRKSTVAGADGYYSTNQNDTEWNKVESALLASAPKGDSGYLKEVRSFDKIADPQKRMEAAEGLISRAQKAASKAPDGPDTSVYVKFTGKAAQYFEQDDKKENATNQNANSGGRPRNESAGNRNPVGYDPGLVPPAFR